MIKLLNILSEAKQVGPLYRFVSYNNLIRLINSNFTIKPSPASSYISFTRNKNLTSDTISSNVRITIDGDKLSERYKINPYADIKAGYSKATQDESEERIDIRKYPQGINIANCITNIDIRTPESQTEEDTEFEYSYTPPSLLDYIKLKDLLKQKGIKYNIVTSYEAI